jgi:HK97 family phage major capsid protein
MELSTQIDNLTTAVMAGQNKQAEEIKNLGAALNETKAANLQLRNELDALITTQAELPKQSTEGELARSLKECDAVDRLKKDGRARFTLKGGAAREVIERKSTITSSTIGFPTAGVMPMEMGSYVEEPRKTLRMRDVIPSRPISVQQYSWPKYSVTGTKASPVAEASAKPINTFDPTTVTERVKTIATYFKIGRQAFDDYSELEGLINSLGSYKINAEMDRQILTGSNTGEDLDGLITQATAFDSALLSASTGYTYFDQIAAAAQQVGEADEFEPTFFVVHPRNWWQMKRLKDDEKNYLLSGPRGTGAAEAIWGMTPVATTQISSGTFLVGSGTSPAVEFRPRMELEVMISAEDGDNFKENMYTVRFEARGLLAVYRPGSFITGTFLNSPAQS